MLKRIKWENIFMILISPLAIIQFIKAAEGFKIASIIMRHMKRRKLYGCFYLIIKMIRKEVK